ncbi:MAG: transposase [Acidobacteriota bacterium]|nr:transposase [Acidobacteriota bacterium]
MIQSLVLMLNKWLITLDMMDKVVSVLDNNAAERSRRGPVVSRKISGGTRSAQVK